MNKRQILSAFAVAAIVIGAPLTGHAAAPAGGKGAELFTKNGCVACHGLGAKDPKKMGPSFAAIAGKYAPKDVDRLAKKIREGGAGSFGKIPMPPQAHVSEADAKELARYALSFKGK